MADQYGHSFADDGTGYTDVTNVITAAGQAAVIVQINLLKDLIPDLTAVASTKPDFDEIPPHTAEKLRAEIDLLIIAIDAAPVS